MKKYKVEKIIIYSLILISFTLILSGCSLEDESDMPNENALTTCGDGECQRLEKIRDNCPEDCNTITTNTPVTQEEINIETDNQNKNIPGEYEFTIELDGLQRQFIVYIPKKQYMDKAKPVVFNFHGGFGNGEQQCETSKMYNVSDKYGFIVVCPDGTPSNGGRSISKKLLYWNDGQLNTPSQINEVNDVHFVEAMIDYLDSNFNINTNKIYSTGLSNGAIFSFRLACELSDKITAIAPVAGSICNMSETCNPSRSVPVIMFNGEEDTNVPYEGGLGSGFADYVFPPVSTSINFWINKNNLSSVVRDTGKIGKSAKYEIYGNNDQAQVILWTLEDGGHNWPGGNSILGGMLLGNINEDIFASEEMWKFFDKYELE